MHLCCDGVQSALLRQQAVDTSSTPAAAGACASTPATHFNQHSSVFLLSCSSPHPLFEFVCVYVCVCVFASVRVFACVCLLVCVCVCLCVCVCVLVCLCRLLSISFCQLCVFLCVCTRVILPACVFLCVYRTRRLYQHRSQRAMMLQA